ncbi:hypothetical protein CRENBAI_007001 [Crenichthys baileyi]|uniref:Uncharacterized protein n=1 Tax=Crenichthys baileyi TaxID=28760 RepID=A0AAV9RU89_9TELE
MKTLQTSENLLTSEASAWMSCVMKVGDVCGDMMILLVTNQEGNMASAPKRLHVGWFYLPGVLAGSSQVQTCLQLMTLSFPAAPGCCERSAAPWLQLSFHIIPLLSSSAAGFGIGVSFEGLEIRRSRGCFRTL